MLLIRIVGMLAAIALGAAVLLYVLTGERRYLRLAWIIFKILLFGLVAILMLLLFERLWIVV